MRAYFQTSMLTGFEKKISQQFPLNYQRKKLPQEHKKHIHKHHVEFFSITRWFLHEIPEYLHVMISVHHASSFCHASVLMPLSSLIITLHILHHVNKMYLNILKTIMRYVYRTSPFMEWNAFLLKIFATFFVNVSIFNLMIKFCHKNALLLIAHATTP